MQPKLFIVKLVFSRTLLSQSAGSVSMGSLAAYLRSLGYVVELCLVDTCTANPETFLQDLQARPVLVIAKPNFKDFKQFLTFFERGKRLGYIKRFFLCGPFAMLNRASIMKKERWVDGIIVDQMESIAAKLCETMSPGLESWDQGILGLLSRNPESGSIGSYVPLSNAIPLDSLPFPARDIEAHEDVNYVNLEMSRGCVFSCSFCHVPSANKEQSRGVLNVVDEIESLHKNYGKTLFIFNDSCFWSTHKDNERIIGFAKEIIRRRIDVRLYVYLKGEPFIEDEPLCWLVKAGLVRVFLGVENSVESSLKVYKKKVGPDLFERVRDKLDRLGVNVHIGFITVEPYSSLESVEANIRYLYRIKKLFRIGVIVEPVRVVPGTSLHHMLISDGLMDRELDYNQITYGYSFRHPEVGALLAIWQSVFRQVLKIEAYNFEYYSTVAPLLMTLVKRLSLTLHERILPLYAVFCEVRKRGEDLLFAYLLYSFRKEYTKKFAGEFKKITAELELLYADIVETLIANGGQRAVREVYVK